jgi:hypothetical protein
VVEKPYAELLSEAGWVWSSKHKIAELMKDWFIVVMT